MNHRSLLPAIALVAACSSDAGGIATSSSGGASSSSGGGSSGGSSSSSSGGSSGEVDGGSDASFPDPLAGAAAPTELRAGFQFTEGPLWFGTKLLVSDIPANKIFEITPPATTPVVFRDPSNGTNGNALGPAGELYSCEGSAGRITKTVGGVVTPVASTFGGAKLNSPNDIIVRNDGNVYFTDPNYYGNTQPKQNVFRIAPGGALTVVDDGIQKPNGVALSPSGNILYVTSAQDGYINAYPVMADGSVGAGAKRKFVDVPSPDGIAVDDAGNVYVASTKVEVFRPDGTKVGSLAVPQQPANVAFGGADRKTLYITARTAVYQARVNVPGPP